MSLVCKINITNKSSEPRSYVLLMDAPDPTQGPAGKIFLNVYDRSPNIGSDASVKWECPITFFAIYGIAQTVPGRNKKVEIRGSQRVALGPGGDTVGLSFDADNRPSFENLRLPSSKARGGFTFRTNEFRFPNDHPTYMGFGAPSPRDSPDYIRPLQTWEAEPLLKTDLFPKLTYLVCSGDLEPGVLADRKMIGQAIRIQFDGSAIPEVSLYQNNSGDYVEAESNRVMTTDPFMSANGVSISVENAL